MKTKADEIQDVVDRETRAWDERDAEALTELFHPDAVWAWPPDSDAHDPASWLLVLGRYDHDRWKQVWEQLFESHDLVHNRRTTVSIKVSNQGDGAFAVVDIDTMWRNRASGEDFHWRGRTCKIYTLTGEGWKMITQTGVLDYSGLQPTPEL
jgi:ketosteroid isomerase-like protein